MCELSQDGLICRTRPIGHMWLGFAKSFFVPAALLSNSSNEQKTGLNWLILISPHRIRRRKPPTFCQNPIDNE